MSGNLQIVETQFSLLQLESIESQRFLHRWSKAAACCPWSCGSNTCCHGILVAKQHGTLNRETHGKLMGNPLENEVNHFWPMGFGGVHLKISEKPISGHFHGENMGKWAFTSNEVFNQWIWRVFPKFSETPTSEKLGVMMSWPRVFE